MKCLYELTLNHRSLIISKVTELSDKDAYVNDSCGGKEKEYNIILLLFDKILDTFRNEGCDSIKNSFFSGFEEFTANTDISANNSIDIKLLIAILKHFRSSINEIIFQIPDDKDTLFKYLDINTKHFDLLEFFLYDHEQAAKKRDILLREELRLQASESKKLLNEALEYNKIRSEFFSNLSHEFRTPLNIILGTIQLVDMYSCKATDVVTEKTKKYYKIMRQNCYRLLRLVNNLIDLNKLDAGYMQLNMENQDIVSIVSKIAASVSDYIEVKGIDFVYYTKIDSQIIACDPDKIERILLNLLSNAIKFTDSGGKIQVNVWAADSKVFLSVKDNGIGIPKEKQDLVFERFVQIEKSLFRNNQGSGIGLCLVKSLVELHEGKISLISDGGKGCEFIIELPIKQLTVMEQPNKESQYSSSNKIEVINIEFSDIYS